jgi:hypothetical protein
VAVSEDDIESWWLSLTDEERTHLMDVAFQPTMDTMTVALVDRLPGLPRMRGSFGGAPFPERMPEPLRSYVKQHRHQRDEASR